MEQILFKLKEIENNIKNFDFKNNNYILDKINNKLDDILYREINKIKKLKDKDNGLFKKIPDEILENILKFIDINSIFKMRLVCELFNRIIKRYIDRNIVYCIMFYMYNRDTYKDYYMLIKCDSCKYIKNNYINKKIISNMFFSVVNKTCKECKYKLLFDDPLHIRNIEIFYIIPYEGFSNINEFLDNKNFLIKFYNEHKIFNSNIILINDEKTNPIFYDIINIILSKSYENVEIYFYGNITEEIYISNSNLLSLTLPDGLMKIKLKLDSIKLLQIYNCNENINFDNYESFLNYILNFSNNIKGITIENKMLECLNSFIFQNKSMDKLKIILKSNKDLIVNNYLSNLILNNKNIKNIELNYINEKNILFLNSIPIKIYINKKYKNVKYLKKYNNLFFYV